jgi:RimJ/RimL family protein N-acetyltransferase
VESKEPHAIPNNGSRSGHSRRGGSLGRAARVTVARLQYLTTHANELPQRKEWVLAMTIRKATMEDLAAIMQIYADAREFMQENDNPGQWINGYPGQGLVESDIQAGSCHACVGNGEIVAVFYYNVERDPTYDKIDGAWLNDSPCGVVHRIARRGGVKGAAARCIEWCLEQCRNVKIDTHKDNAPMRKLLAKLGFTYCGVIWLLDGDERLAFQKCI